MQTGSGVTNPEAVEEMKDDDIFDTESTTSDIDNDREDLIGCRDCGIVFAHLQGLEDHECRKKSIQLPISGKALEGLLRENTVKVFAVQTTYQHMWVTDLKLLWSTRTTVTRKELIGWPFIFLYRDRQSFFFGK